MSWPRIRGWGGNGVYYSYLAKEAQYQVAF